MPQLICSGDRIPAAGQEEARGRCSGQPRAHVMLGIPGSIPWGFPRDKKGYLYHNHRRRGGYDRFIFDGSRRLPSRDAPRCARMRLLLRNAPAREAFLRTGIQTHAVCFRGFPRKTAESQSNTRFARKGAPAREIVLVSGEAFAELPALGQPVFVGRLVDHRQLPCRYAP